MFDLSIPAISVIGRSEWKELAEKPGVVGFVIDDDMPLISNLLVKCVSGEVA